MRAVLRKTTPRKKSVPAAAPAQPVAPQPLSVLTLAQWRENAGLQTELRRLIESPVFQMATQTVTTVAFPGVEPASRAEPGISAEASDQALARRYVHRSGIAFGIRMLKALATANVQMPQTPFDRTLQPEDE